MDRKRYRTAFLLVAGAMQLTMATSCVTSQERRLAAHAAEEEVRKRGWESFRTTRVVQIKAGWRVELRREPEELGGTAEVEVSKDGKVLHYYPGK
jgi:hypothetical protein